MVVRTCSVVVSWQASIRLVCASLVFLGCKEDHTVKREAVAADLGPTVCEPLVACDCEAEGVKDQATCEDALAPSLEAALVEGELLRLEYHPECVDRYGAFLTEQGCAKPTDDLSEVATKRRFDASRCKLLSGPSDVGERCRVVSAQLGDPALVLGDTCHHALACANEVCVPLPRKRGQLCVAAVPGLCPPELSCLDPDGDAVATCEPVSLAGEPCNPHDERPCEEKHYCDLLARICQLPPGAGESCGRVANGPRGVCDEETAICDEATGTCDALPDEGEDCPEGRCKEGLACVRQPGGPGGGGAARVCEALPGNGDPCLEGECTEGSICNGASCEALPTAGEDCIRGECAEGFRCRDGGCVDDPARVCAIVDTVGTCVYAGDGICDEPGGTGYCAKGTDPADCTCAFEDNGECDEPEGTGRCPEGSDAADCAGSGATDTGG